MMDAKKLWSKATAAAKELHGPKTQWAQKAKALGASIKGKTGVVAPKIGKAKKPGKVMGEHGEAVPVLTKEGWEAYQEIKAAADKVKVLNIDGKSAAPNPKLVDEAAMIAAVGKSIWVDEMDFAGVSVKECQAAIKAAIDDFGSYSYGDKGPEEVMDIAAFVHRFKKMPAAEAAKVLVNVGKKNGYGAAFSMACAINMQDWDELFQQPGMEDALEGEFK